MAINIASKFESKTSDLIKAVQKSKPFTNNDWDWDGVGAINVYTLVDPTIGNYDATAAGNRYGTPSEVQDTIQTWTLQRDRAWTKVIDKKNAQDTQGVRSAGKYLAQATKNVFVPEFDTYIFQTLASALNSTTARDANGRGTFAGTTATTAANAFSNFTTLKAQIVNDEGSETGLVAAMTPAYYNLLKQGGFVLDSENFAASRHNGDYGMVDGVSVTLVPSSRMPSVTIAAATKVVDLIIAHPTILTAPEKLTDYTLHNNPPGYSGDLLEYRHRYDAFADTNKLVQGAFHAS